MSVVEPPSETDVIGGFGTVDEKGRVVLSKAVRQALGLHSGSSVAYIALGDRAVLLIPQDEHLAALMERGVQALEAAGLTAQDLLDQLPAARAEVFTDTYGEAFVREMEQLRAQSQADQPGQAG